MTWNEDRERLIAAAELGDATPQIEADFLVEARKRAFEAEHAISRVNEAYKAAADRLRSDLVQRTSERDAAREELKSLRYNNLMAITAQEKAHTDQMAMAEAACCRDATALGVLQVELAALKAAHAWIKTSERMPDAADGSCCDVLAIVAGSAIVLNYTPDDAVHPWADEFSNIYRADEVTHWQPLTEPPK